MSVTEAEVLSEVYVVEQQVVQEHLHALNSEEPSEGAEEAGGN